MDVTISAGFSSRPYDARLRVYTRAVSGNSSAYHGDRYGYSRSGYGSYNNDSHAVNSWIAGQGYGPSGVWFKFAPGDFAGKTIGWGGWDTGFIGHDGNGYLNFTSRIQVPSVSPFGAADTGDTWMSATRIPQVPGAPSVVGLGLDQITTTTMRYRFSGTTDGGSAITGWQAQYSTSADFSSGVVTVASNGTTIQGGLAPGTQYWWRSRGLNGVGAGPWSAVVSATTLPAVAPGLSVSPLPSGTRATVLVSPPGGVSGVDKYYVHVSPGIGTGGGVTVITITSPLTSQTVTGFTPGETYTFSAEAIIGGYTSPTSTPFSLTFPQPNVSAGAYYDGASGADTDVSYGWAATADASKSLALGVGVTGWADGAGASGATVAGVQHVTGADSGTGSALVRILADATAAGVWGGLDATSSAARSAVVGDALYVNALAVRPSRAQLMQATVIWLAAGVELSRSHGSPVLVTSTTDWTQLLVSATSPHTADGAVIIAEDVAGTGWSAWLGGDYFQIDSAIITLPPFPGFFYGNTAAGAGYAYSFTGAANASTSQRVPSTDSGPDPLQDPDCPPMPEPPQVPDIPTDCIDDVGVWRRFSFGIPATVVRRWTATIPTLKITTGSIAERQVRVRYYPNPDGLAPELLNMTEWAAEQILTYVPPFTTITLDGVSEQVSAEVQGADPVPADNLLFGSNNAPADWPVLTCGLGYVIALDTPTDSPIGNLSARLLVTQRM